MHYTVYENEFRLFYLSFLLNQIPSKDIYVSIDVYVMYVLLGEGHKICHTLHAHTN